MNVCDISVVKLSPNRSPTLLVYSQNLCPAARQQILKKFNKLRLISSAGVEFYSFLTFLVNIEFTLGVCFSLIEIRINEF